MTGSDKHTRLSQLELITVMKKFIRGKAPVAISKRDFQGPIQ
jgi:hypothetical protein